MTNHQLPITKYPLLPFSQLVYDSTRWLPQVYRFPMTIQIKGGAKELKRWEDAIRAALGAHLVFSSLVDIRGRQCAGSQNDILKGKYHHIALYTSGDDLVIRGHISRILGDGTSLMILMDDIRRAYISESIESDDYWGYLEYIEQQKKSDHYRISHDWLTAQFADESIPVHPTLDRPLWTI